MLSFNAEKTLLFLAFKESKLMLTGTGNWLATKCENEMFSYTLSYTQRKQDLNIHVFLC